MVSVCKTTSSLTRQNNVIILAQGTQKIIFMSLVIGALDLPIQVLNIKVRSDKQKTNQREFPYCSLVHSCWARNLSSREPAVCFT